MDRELISTSKFLSLVLRHHPEKNWPLLVALTTSTTLVNARPYLYQSLSCLRSLLLKQITELFIIPM